MALSHAIPVNLVHRHLLARCPTVYGGLRRYSEGVKEVITTTQQQQKQDGGTGQQQQQQQQGRVRGFTDRKVSQLDKYALVWSGKFKTVAEVPDLVSQDVVERAKNKARIKVNLIMVAATLLACIGMIYSGKQARAAGESVVKINQDWHNKINEEHRRSLEKAN